MIPHRGKASVAYIFDNNQFPTCMHVNTSLHVFLSISPSDRSSTKAGFVLLIVESPVGDA